jgi:hypothetical protein
MQVPQSWQDLVEYLKSQLELVDSLQSHSENLECLRERVVSRAQLLEKHDPWKFMRREFLCVLPWLLRPQIEL